MLRIITTHVHAFTHIAQRSVIFFEFSSHPVFDPAHVLRILRLLDNRIFQSSIYLQSLFKRLTFKRANKSVINTKYMIILIYFHRLTYIFLP